MEPYLSPEELALYDEIEFYENRRDILYVKENLVKVINSIICLVIFD